LKEAGFTEYRRNAVDHDLENGFRCWVGLNCGQSRNSVQINPFVGVHSVPIEKLWTGLKAGKYPGKCSRGVATVARHMGELQPDEAVFRFDQRTDLIAESRRLAMSYCSVGLPFARSIATYSALLPMLQQRVETLGAYPERLASCLILLGRQEEVLAFVHDFAARHHDYFEGFAAPFIERISHQAAPAQVPLRVDPCRATSALSLPGTGHSADLQVPRFQDSQTPWRHLAALMRNRRRA
jgi:hypothetical protein